MLLRLNVTNLPCIPYPALASQLRTCLAAYGTVRETVIYEENDGWFAGAGYAYLELPPNPDRVLKPLTYRIPLDDKTSFLATWHKMGVHCRYCKEMNHEVDHCPSKPRESRSCYLCGETGHLQAQCVHDTPRDLEANKRPRKAAINPVDDRLIAPRRKTPKPAVKADKAPTPIAEKNTPVTPRKMPEEHASEPTVDSNVDISSDEDIPSHVDTSSDEDIPSNVGTSSDEDISYDGQLSEDSCPSDEEHHDTNDNSPPLIANPRPESGDITMDGDF